MAPEFLINQTGIMYAILNGLTMDVTGSWFLTGLMVVMGIILIAIALRIPIEWTAVLVVPLLIVLMAFEGDFIALGGVLLIYLGVLLGKNIL